jgi:hypothetical protein
MRMALIELAMSIVPPSRKTLCRRSSLPTSQRSRLQVPIAMIKGASVYHWFAKWLNVTQWGVQGIVQADADSEEDCSVSYECFKI